MAGYGLGRTQVRQLPGDPGGAGQDIIQQIIEALSQRNTAGPQRAMQLGQDRIQGLMPDVSGMAPGMDGIESFLGGLMDDLGNVNEAGPERAMQLGREAMTPDYEAVGRGMGMEGDGGTLQDLINAFSSGGMGEPGQGEPGMMADAPAPKDPSGGGARFNQFMDDLVALFGGGDEASAPPAVGGVPQATQPGDVIFGGPAPGGTPGEIDGSIVDVDVGGQNHMRNAIKDGDAPVPDDLGEDGDEREESAIEQAESETDAEEDYPDLGTGDPAPDVPSSDFDEDLKAQIINPGRETDGIQRKSYTVKKGDTLWAIAERVFGDGRYYKQIQRMNGIRNPDKIQAGAIIMLPNVPDTVRNLRSTNAISNPKPRPKRRVDINV